MNDFEARSIIEALRNGISSKKVGTHFNTARKEILGIIQNKIDSIISNNSVESLIINANYGDGKTHLLDTVSTLALNKNLVVSKISISKETPMNRLDIVYSKLLQHTYLPDSQQVGISSLLEQLTPKSSLLPNLIKQSESYKTNKLYYLLKSLAKTTSVVDRLALIGDLEGDFVHLGSLKKTYNTLYNEKANFSEMFRPKNGCNDYFSFLSQLFIDSKYNGWVILFDEAEMIGGMSKKTRINSYLQIGNLISNTGISLKSTFSMFAFTSSFNSEVVDKKSEFNNVSESSLSIEDKQTAENTLNAIKNSYKLGTLSEEENIEIITKIIEIHAQAYNWKPNIDPTRLYGKTKEEYMMRTRIRITIEALDQLLQYGKIDSFDIAPLSTQDYEEKESLSNLDDEDVIL
jgi:phage-related protein